jgi:hypothetical protein
MAPAPSGPLRLRAPRPRNQAAEGPTAPSNRLALDPPLQIGPTRRDRPRTAIDRAQIRAVTPATVRSRAPSSTRREQLERLGWTFHRIRSQDWFQDNEREIEKAGAAYQLAIAAAENNQDDTGWLTTTQ